MEKKFLADNTVIDEVKKQFDKQEMKDQEILAKEKIREKTKMQFTYITNLLNKNIQVEALFHSLFTNIDLDMEEAIAPRRLQSIISAAASVIVFLGVWRISHINAKLKWFSFIVVSCFTLINCGLLYGIFILRRRKVYKKCLTYTIGNTEKKADELAALLVENNMKIAERLPEPFLIYLDENKSVTKLDDYIKFLYVNNKKLYKKYKHHTLIKLKYSGYSDILSEIKDAENNYFNTRYQEYRKDTLEGCIKKFLNHAKYEARFGPVVKKRTHLVRLIRCWGVFGFNIVLCAVFMSALYFM